MPGSRVVDVHAHVVVSDLFAAGPLEPGGAALEEVSGRRRLHVRGKELASVVGEFVDPARIAAEASEAGVDHVVLSPWVQLLPLGLPLDEARRRCTVQNAALARIVASDPARFSALGAVPIEFPEAAAAALAAACVDGLSGVELAANSANYLGEETLEPFWTAAERLSAIVLVHPATRGITLPALDEFYLWNTVGNPAETAIAAAHLALRGVLERHPQLRIVLAHGGGALPALRGRLAHGQRAVAAAGGLLSEPIESSLARFYFDSVTHDATTLRRLVGDAGADHVLLGSDRPFDMGDPDPVGSVRRLGLRPGDERALLGGNADRLLGGCRGTGAA